MSATSPRFLTIKQLAARLGVSERTIYRLRDRGQLRPRMLAGRGVKGRQIPRYALKDVEEFERRLPLAK